MGGEPPVLGSNVFDRVQGEPGGKAPRQVRPNCRWCWLGDQQCGGLCKAWNWPATLPRMSNLCLSISRRISAPQQRVWDVITDLEGCPERIAAIASVEMLTGPEVAVGTRWKETRLIFERKSTETMEITAFEPPLRYVVEADSCGAHLVSELRCEPDGDDATVLSMTMETTPTNFFAKLMKPLAKLAMGTTRKMLERDLDDIAFACTGGKPLVEPAADEAGSSEQ